jgi:hypothetical protein
MKYKEKSFIIFNSNINKNDIKIYIKKEKNIFEITNKLMNYLPFQEVDENSDLISNPSSFISHSFFIFNFDIYKNFDFLFFKIIFNNNNINNNNLKFNLKFSLNLILNFNINNNNNKGKLFFLNYFNNNNKKKVNFFFLIKIIIKKKKKDMK